MRFRRWLPHVIGVFVAVNLVCVFGATVVTPLHLEVLVVDARDGQPVPAASLALHRADPMRFEVLGTTDSTGRFEHDRVVRCSPIWMFPKIGRVSIVENELQVFSDEHEDFARSLSEFVSGWFVWSAEVRVRVELHPR